MLFFSSTDYNAAKLALLLRLSGRVDSYTIACHIASGDCRKTTELEYRYLIKSNWNIGI